MDFISVSSAALNVRADKPLSPAMRSAIWEIAACLDEQRIPANVTEGVWLTMPTARLRGPNARSDNVWLRECLDRMTGLKVSGESREGEWLAVMLAEARFLEGGAIVKLFLPPKAVHALRSPATFAKIETFAAHRLPPHARRLYAILADKKRQENKYAQWSLEPLRALLGVDEMRSYDRWSDFRTRVLDPAVEAINAFGTVKLKMTPVKLGRSVAAVRFDWKWKQPDEADDILEQNERHSLARSKAQSASDAPPTIEEPPTQALGESPPPLAEATEERAMRAWWRGLLDEDKERWKDAAGRTFIAGGVAYTRNAKDQMKACFDLYLSRQET